MSITRCLRKVPGVDSTDAANIKSLANAYVAEGMKPIEAGVAAVTDVLTDIRGERDTLVKQIEKKGGVAPRRSGERDVLRAKKREQRNDRSANESPPTSVQDASPVQRDTVASSQRQSPASAEGNTGADRDTVSAAGRTDTPSRAGGSPQVDSARNTGHGGDLKLIADARLDADGELDLVADDNSSIPQLTNKLARLFKAPIVAIRDRNGRARFDAATLNGKIYLNVDAKSPLIPLIMHEIGHNLPKDIKKKLITAVMDTVTPAQKKAFLKEFNFYQDKSIQDEELVMRIIEQDAQNPEFWKKISRKTGVTDFQQIAEAVLKILDKMLQGFRRENSSQFTADIDAVRDAVAEAYASALARPSDAVAVPAFKSRGNGEREIPSNFDDLVSLDQVVPRAQVGSYKTNRDLKVEIQRSVSDASKVYGLDLSQENAQTEAYLTRVGVRDALHAIKSNQNAIGWYDVTVTKAKKILSKIHPELATDKEAEFAFTWALAVTSNGMKINDNFKLAEKAYSSYKANGKMPTNIGVGNAAPNINDGLTQFNDMVEAMGAGTASRFMATEFSFGQLKKFGFKVTGELVDEMVRGAAVLGPKIGNGFYSNLNGLFDQLTMDRWLMRTWGRWTGTLINERPDMVRSKRDELKTLVRKIKINRKDTQAFESVLGGKLQVGRIDALAAQVQKASMLPANRAVMNQTQAGENIRKVGNALAKYLDGQKEAPSNGKERRWIRQIFTNVLEDLQNQGYPTLNMSDLQALLWYPERRLYDIAKSDQNVSDGYADDAAPDYANAAAALAKSSGVSEADINEAIAEGINDHEARVSAGPTRPGDGGSEAELQSGGGFSQREKRNFVNERIFVPGRISRAGDEKARSFKGPSRGADQRVGSLLTHKPTAAFANLLKSSNLPAPEITELASNEESAKQFLSAIEASKSSSRYGAAVYVYPQSEYQNMRLFQTADGKSGFAIKSDGDIVSVYSSGGGISSAMLALAVEQGGTKLDAFDTQLVDIYQTNGFKEVSREPWNDQYQPDGWDKELFGKFNGGEPDVVFMEYDGAFDPAEDVRFSAQPAEPPPGDVHGLPPAKLVPFNKPSDARWERFVRRVQDRHRVLKKVVENIEEADGNITDENNAYRVEEAFHGKTEEDIRELEEDHVDGIVKSMNKAEVSQAELDLYLIARHAKERNAHIATINSEMPDGGSGMTNADAARILLSVSKDPRYQGFRQVASMVDSMLALQRQKVRDGGLESDEVIDAWEASYKFYVPLKGFANDELNDDHPSTGAGFSIRGKESFRAMGRQSMPSSPLINSISDTARALVRYQKNEVGKSLMKLVEENYNPGYWEVFGPGNPDRERGTDAKGQVIPDAPIQMHARKDRYLPVKKDGEVYYVKLADDRLIKAMANLDPDVGGWLIQTSGAMVRFLSSMATSYNPGFIPLNFIRDIQSAVMNVLAEQDLTDGRVQGKKIATKMVKSTPRAIRAIYRHYRGKTPTNEFGQYFDEFLADGAKTGFFDSKTLRQQQKSVERMVLMTEGGVVGNSIKGAKSVMDYVEHLNTAIENGVRLSAYTHARKAGTPRAQAASLAKNLTVNFNRKGELGPTVSSLYMFANASIQGTATFSRSMLTFKDADKWHQKLNLGQKAALTLASTGFALSAAMRHLGGEDDDGEAWVDKIPAWERERNIALFNPFGEPGERFNIPLPYGYSIFYNIGDALESLAFSDSDKRNVSTLGVELAMAALGSFSPVSVQNSDEPVRAIAKTVAPTLLQPTIQIALNENFMGTPISEEQNDFEETKSDSHTSMRSTKKFYKDLALTMNNLTGGTMYRPGAIDISPDSIEHVAEFVGGGLYRFTSRAWETGRGLAVGTTPELRNVPILRSLYKEPVVYQDQSDFYDRRNEIKAIRADLRNMTGADRLSYRIANEGKLNLWGSASFTAKRLSALRKQRDRWEGDSGLTEAQLDDKLDAIEVKQKEAIDRFNRQWNDAN